MTSDIRCDDIDIEHFENEIWSFNIYPGGEGRNVPHYDEKWYGNNIFQ